MQEQHTYQRLLRSIDHRLAARFLIDDLGKVTANGNLTLGLPNWYWKITTTQNYNLHVCF